MPDLRAIFLILSSVVFHASAIAQFRINLDLPPRQRWGELVRYYKDVFPDVLRAWNKEMVEGVGKVGMAQWKTALLATIQPEFLEEIDGIVTMVNHPDVTHDGMLLWNAMYELNHPTFCTGILAATENGTVYHGRNMDYGFLWWHKGVPQDLDSITHEVIFMKEGKKMYVSTAWPGHLGIHTGMRFGHWSVEINLRPNTYGENLKGAQTGGIPHGLLVRQFMNTVTEYDDAVEHIWNANLAAPCYVVLAGARPFQGTIVTKDRNVVRAQSTPSLFSLSPTNWHLAQTNDDLDGMALDIRRPIINAFLQVHAQKDVSSSFMLEQMRLPPAFNQATKFTSVYVPSTGEHYTFLAGERAVIGVVKNSLSVLDRYHLRGWQRFMAPAPTSPPRKGPPKGTVDTSQQDKQKEYPYIKFHAPTPDPNAPRFQPPPGFLPPGVQIPKGSVLSYPVAR